jgi:hypothetical protein
MRYWSTVLFAALAIAALVFVLQAACGALRDGEARPEPPPRRFESPAMEEPLDWPVAPPVLLPVEPLPAEAPIVGAIKRLQPVYARQNRARDARRIAGIIERAAERNRIDPHLAVAIAMRESSLRADPGRGSLGEQGMFQVHPRGYARRVCQGTCDLSQPGCNAEVALCYLAHVRELCPGSTWRWVAAYGMSRCPTEREARAMTTTRRARRYLVVAAGEARAAEIWPEG